MVPVLLRRLVGLVLVLFGVSLLVFLIMQLVPGDPARAALGLGATAERVQEVRVSLGLDKPLPTQYVHYLDGLVHGDLGTSLTLSQPVSDVVFPKLGNTVLLSAAALLICVVVGVPLGMLAATRQYSAFDRLSMFLSLAGASVPVYWAALVAVSLFSLKLGWFPTSGKYDARDPGGALDVLRHLVLPALTTAVVPTAVVARLTRSAMVETLQMDHMRMLRASGVPESRIIGRHALRGIAPPVVNILGLQVGYLLGGVIFAEVVFGWPGLGGQLYTSITANDMPVIQAGVLFIAVVFVVVNLLADIVVALLDPRTREVAA